MATATPVFERRIATRERGEEQSDLRYDGMTADDVHNARISDNLARLLNPENKIKDVVASIDAHGTQVVQSAPEVEPVQPVYQAPVHQAVNTATAAQPVYVVKNARANADIFRADSPVNFVRGVQAPAAIAVEEDESEDLRPTPTTIQYQTIGADGATIENSAAHMMSEGEIERPEERYASESKINLKKRDKIILGVIVGLILAVFVLIIVNSAIISGLNSDITALENSVESVRAEYNQVMSDIEYAESAEGILSAAKDYGFIY